jgi:fatty acid synthase subunit alpha, fungi type
VLIRASSDSLTNNDLGANVNMCRTELISAVPSWNPTFIERNFTEAEITYCQSQCSPSSSFAARWVGKEAVFKSLGVSSKGAGAAMKDIEILPNDSGAPTVILHGDARTAAQNKGIEKVLVSLSHSDVRHCSGYLDQRIDILHGRLWLSLSLRRVTHDHSKPISTCRLLHNHP